MNKKSRRNRIILAALAAVLIALYIVGALFGLHSGGIYTNRTDIRDLNEGRSQILVTGKNYTLENEQEEKYLEEQRKKQEEQQTVPDPDKNQNKEVADSIVTEDLMEHLKECGIVNYTEEALLLMHVSSGTLTNWRKKWGKTWRTMHIFEDEKHTP